MDWGLLLQLTEGVPLGLNRKQKKEPIAKEMRGKIVERDGTTCRLCGRQGEFGNPLWDLGGSLSVHHVAPNGPATTENLIVLCYYCHQAVHLLLWRAGKWKYSPM